MRREKEIPPISYRRAPFKQNTWRYPFLKFHLLHVHVYGRVKNSDRHSVDYSVDYSMYHPTKLRVYGNILAHAFTITFGHHLVTAIFSHNETQGGICIKIEFNHQKNISLLQHGRLDVMRTHSISPGE